MEHAPPPGDRHWIAQGIRAGMRSQQGYVLSDALALNSGVGQSTSRAMSPITCMSFCHTPIFMVAG